MSMTEQTPITADTATTIDIVPVALARRLLTPPRNASEIDAPLWCWACPYCGKINLVPEELTLWPHLTECRYGPVILQQGPEIFLGSHLLVGYPEALPDRLRNILQRLAATEREGGHESRWIATRPLPAATVAQMPAKPAPAKGKLETVRSNLFQRRPFSPRPAPAIKTMPTEELNS
jgi:hypothetical protein